MNKPMSMLAEEFEHKLIETINNCGLPSCMIEAIVKNIYFEVRDLSNKSTELEKAKYNEELAKQAQQKAKEVNADEEDRCN